jgi:hypothetical protein
LAAIQGLCSLHDAVSGRKLVDGSLSEGHPNIPQVPSPRLHRGLSYPTKPQFLKKLPVSHNDFKSLMDWWSPISAASSDTAKRRHDLRLQRRVVQKVQSSINKADNHHGAVKTSIKTILRRLHYPKSIRNKENAYGRQLSGAGNGGGSPPASSSPTLNVS